ncbi:hypothetical protein B0H17DRAFT_1218394 [Mycena rosella]|uniref:Uncharacterized protein n=1 Tax=Mycena rosella TaxID=1033263 RepID=A0AAD7BQM4_MYCRO|nr:hypothetical protein B0H17DRAFT_1218394 [Mycena rosella]
MCILWHRCYHYDNNIRVISLSYNERHSLKDYIRRFADSMARAPTITDPHIDSVTYCRSRGPTAYYSSSSPSNTDASHVGPTKDNPDAPCYDTREEEEMVSVAGFDQTVHDLVGTRRYDVCHTMTFPLILPLLKAPPHRPYILDPWPSRTLDGAGPHAGLGEIAAAAACCRGTAAHCRALTRRWLCY